MNMLLAGLALFFIPHFYSAFRSRTPGKDIKERMGEKPYMGLYSVLSLAGFALFCIGYVKARPSDILYTPPSWGAMANIVLMLFALIFVTASQLPAGNIKKRLKHPMLVSVKIWAIGHLLANGELNSVLLFGTFLVYAVIDRIRVKRRGDVGAALAVPDTKWDIISLLVGGGLFAAIILWLHPLLFGVPVI